MAGNPFRAPSADATPQQPPKQRGENPLKSRKTKKVSFVSPPPTPEENDDGMLWDRQRKSPPPDGEFGIDVKALLQPDGADELDMDRQVEAMMAQQRLQRETETASRRAPTVQFAQSTKNMDNRAVGRGAESGKKMDVDAFARMLMGSAVSHPSERPESVAAIAEVSDPTTADDDRESLSASSFASASASEISSNDASSSAEVSPGKGSNSNSFRTTTAYDDQRRHFESDKTAAEQELGMTSRGDTRPPPPPITRRAMAKALEASGQRSRSNSAQERQVPRHADQSTPPPPPHRSREPPVPPASRSTARTEQAPTAVIATASGAPSAISHAATAGMAASSPTPPPPPPPRRKHDAKPPSMPSRRRSQRTETSDSTSDTQHQAQSSGTGGADMLADLDALQREVDALRSRVGQ